MTHTGTVPLTLHIDGKTFTRQVERLTFRKEAVGGVKSIGFSIMQPTSDDELSLRAFSRVYVSDARTGSVIAEGRISDTGRDTTEEGTRWEGVAFGPAAHAADITFPYIVIDNSLERWNLDSNHNTNHAITTLREEGPGESGIQCAATVGGTVATGFIAEAQYRHLFFSSQKLARCRTDWRAGNNDTDFKRQMVVRTTINGGGVVGASGGFSTAGGAFNVDVGSDFTNGHDIVSVRMDRENTSTTGTINHWVRFYNLGIRAIIHDKSGSEITSYPNMTVTASDVVADLLGRGVLPQFNGSAAVVQSTSYAIDQMAYPDGVTPEDVLEDCMLLEPGYRWTTGPSHPVTGKYEFRWEAYPTSPRYFLTLDDGGSFPLSTQEVYNKVAVRWKDKRGRERTQIRSMAAEVLDAAGITRQGWIDLGDEISSASAANRAGDRWLDEHNVPANSGTVRVTRPVEDVRGGRILPHEIEPGELAVVRGVETYSTFLRNTNRDGRSVYRITSVTYDSDSGTATLELDEPARTTANLLAKQKKRKKRKR